MPPGASSKRLPLALYRAVLRWARDNRDVPFALRSSDVYALAPQLRSAALSLQDAAAIPAIARAAFEAGRAAQGAEAQAEALDRGLEAVRLLHTSYSPALQEMRHTRSDRADRDGVLFSIGQVFVHKKYNYRAAIYGWDRSCKRDEEWMRTMGVSPEAAAQPFYHCLPDEADCQRLFGGVRITKYVAQDNVQPVEGCRVAHRALDAFFAAYSPALGRYIPSRKLQFEYPDAYEAADAAPVGDDSNILKQPEHLAAEPAGGKRRKPRPVPGDGGRSFASP